MPRPVTVSEAQQQLLETGLDLYRMVYRLHCSREGLNWQGDIEHEIYGEMDVSAEPPTVELAVAMRSVALSTSFWRPPTGSRKQAEPPTPRFGVSGGRK